MFNEHETTTYNNLFNEIGITDETTQKKVLEFFYTLGAIAYNIQTF